MANGMFGKSKPVFGISQVRIAPVTKMILAAGACVLALGSTSSFADTQDFVGRWMNTSQDSSGITGLAIRPSRDGLSVRIFGRCRGQEVCDWNVDQADLYARRDENNRFDRSDRDQSRWFRWDFGNRRRDTDVITLEFDAGYARKLIVLRPARNNELRAEVFTTWPDRRGRPGYVTESRFQQWGRPQWSDHHSNRGDRWDHR